LRMMTESAMALEPVCHPFWKKNAWKIFNKHLRKSYFQYDFYLLLHCVLAYNLPVVLKFNFSHRVLNCSKWYLYLNIYIWSMAIILAHYKLSGSIFS
jgi:hypothetical protein